MTTSEAFAAYELDVLVCDNKAQKTIDNYRTVLNSFLRVNPDIPIQMLDIQHIVLWRRRMALDGLATASMASHMGRMRKVLRYMKKLRYQVLDPDEVELPKVKKKKVEILMPDQVQDMIDAADNFRDKALVALVFSCGGRIHEILNLNRDDIRDGEATIIGKGGKQGTLDFDEDALRLLDTYLSTRTDRLRPLFISSQRRRLGYARVNQIMHELADRAGIEINVTSHILRHSFATDLLLNGADIMMVKEQLRHEDVSTTMRYLHVTDKYKKDAHRKFHTKIGSDS